MEGYIIDTNVISDFLNNSFSENGMNFISEIIDSSSKISFITQIELLCWKTDSETEYWIKEFILSCETINISETIIQECVYLRRNKKIKLPDAIIAATALVTNCKIITNNAKDFEGIHNLKIVNPYNL